MKLSLYTIDDLRLGYDPRGQGWRLSQFLDWRDALEHYCSLPDTAAKSLGVTNGVQVLELVRCYEGEDVLVLDFLALPLWRGEESVIRLAGELVSARNIRYCLDGGRLIPAPTQASVGWHTAVKAV